jgi:hypothetical protein
MGTTLTPDNLPAGRPAILPPGHDVGSLGPSDSSDSGSDMVGSGVQDDEALDLEREASENIPEASDIDTDRVVGADEAGVGYGLDEAEKAERDPVGKRSDLRPPTSDLP